MDGVDSGRQYLAAQVCAGSIPLVVFSGLSDWCVVANADGTDPYRSTRGKGRNQNPPQEISHLAGRIDLVHRGVVDHTNRVLLAIEIYTARGGIPGQFDPGRWYFFFAGPLMNMVSGGALAEELGWRGFALPAAA
jgi:hypothetical protein